MPRQKKPATPRKRSRSPKDVVVAVSASAPESLLPKEGVPSSDIERAVQHTATSEETGVHGGADEPGVTGFLEPR